MMLEQGKKKRVVACAFDWPGWDRTAKIDTDVLEVLAAYRPRYAKIAERAGFDAEFTAMGGEEIDEFAPKVGVKLPLETRDDTEALRAHRDAFVEAIREHHSRAAPAPVLGPCSS